jgi:hypothetical protein
MMIPLAKFLTSFCKGTCLFWGFPFRFNSTFSLPGSRTNLNSFFCFSNSIQHSNSGTEVLGHFSSEEGFVCCF